MPFFIVHKLIIKQQTGYITFPGTVTGEGGTVGELEHREKTKLRVHQHGDIHQWSCKLLSDLCHVYVNEMDGVVIERNCL